MRFVWSPKQEVFLGVLFVIFVGFFGVAFSQTQDTTVRQDPLISIDTCRSGEYAQINKDGLICTSASSVTVPECVAGVDCCGAQEFVKITPQGLECVPVAEGHVPVCDDPDDANDDSSKPSCNDCPSEGCCGKGEFAVITPDGLACSGLPVWSIRSLRIPQNTVKEIDFLSPNSEVRAFGSPPLSFALVEPVPVEPSGITFDDDDLLAGGSVLTITTPEVISNTPVVPPVKVKLSNSVNGIDNEVTGFINITVVGPPCTDHSECPGGWCSSVTGSCGASLCFGDRCTTDSQCNTGACNVATGLCDSCTANTHCCISGSCNTSTNTCECIDNNSCPAGKVCNQYISQCVDPACENAQCSQWDVWGPDVSDRCGSFTQTRSCSAVSLSEGDCVIPNERRPATGSLICPDTQVCNNEGVCSSNLPCGSPCTAHGQCSAGYCSFGTCDCFCPATTVDNCVLTESSYKEADGTCVSGTYGSCQYACGTGFTDTYATTIDSSFSSNFFPTYSSHRISNLGQFVSFASDDTLIVSATNVCTEAHPTRAGQCNNAGPGVYLFTKSGATWQVAAAINSTTSPTTRMGTVVSAYLDRQTLFVLDNREDLYIYTKSGTSWEYDSAVDLARVTTTPSALTLSSNGNTLFVGDRGYSSSSGAVHIYEKSGSSWTYAGRIADTQDITASDYLGSSVASDGFNTLAIGAPSAESSVSGYPAGVIYLYSRFGDTWKQTATLDSAFSSTHFPTYSSHRISGLGQFVSFAADGTLIVSATNVCTEAHPTRAGQCNSGKFGHGVYLLSHNGSTWEVDAAISSSADHRIATVRSAQISGQGNNQTLFVLDSGEDVHIYTKSGDSWINPSVVDVGVITTTPSALTLSSNGNTLFVGDRGYSSSSGAVHIYEKSGSSWTYAGRIADTQDITASDYLGSSVASDGFNTLAIGAPSAESSVSGYPAGVIYLYSRFGDTWKQTATLDSAFSSTHFPTYSSHRISGLGQFVSFAADGTLIVSATNVCTEAHPTRAGQCNSGKFGHGVYLLSHNGSTWEVDAAISSSADHRIATVRSAQISGQGNNQTLFVLDSGEDVHIYTKSGDSWINPSVVDVGVITTTPSALTLSSNGNTLFVGDRGYSSSSGAVHIYEKSGSSWTYAGRIADTQDITASDYLGSSVASDGFNTLAIGAPSAESSVSGYPAGVIYLYSRFGDTWKQTATLDSAFSSTHFPTYSSHRISGLGQFVSFAADGTLIVSATNVCTEAHPTRAGQCNSGKFGHGVYLLSHNGSTWEVDAAISSSADHRIATVRSAQISGQGNNQTLFVLDSGEDVHIYTKSGDSWINPSVVDVGVITTTPSALTLSSNGNTLFVGDRGYSSSSGAVHIYEKSGSSWTYAGRIADTQDITASDYLGSSVASDGFNTLAIGAPSAESSVSGYPAGVIYLYSRFGDTWKQTATLDSAFSSTHFPTYSSHRISGLGQFVSFAADGTLIVSATNVCTEAHPTRAGQCNSGKFGHGVYLLSHNGSTWEVDAAISSSADHRIATVRSAQISGQGNNQTLFVLDSGEDVHIYTKSGDSWINPSVVDVGVITTTPSALTLSSNGNTLFVGDRGYSSSSGAVHIYEKSGSSWTYAGRIADTQDITASDYLGSSVASDGFNTLAIGAPSAESSVSGYPAGVIYLYSRFGDTWKQTATLDSAFSSTHFPTYSSHRISGLGQFVSFAADGTLIVSATNVCTEAHPTRAGQCNSGKFGHGVYLLSHNGSTWEVDAAISSSADHRIATVRSAQISGQGNNQTLFVLDSGEDVHIYTKSGDSWINPSVVDVGVITTTPSALTLSSNGNTLFVGDRGYSSSSGAVHIYEKSGSSWTYAGRIADTQDITASDYLGSSVASDGFNTLAIGAPSAESSVSGYPAGVIYLYSRFGDTWKQTATLDSAFSSTHFPTYSSHRISGLGQFVSFAADGTLIVSATNVCTEAHPTRAGQCNSGKFGHGVYLLSPVFSLAGASWEVDAAVNFTATSTTRMGTVVSAYLDYQTLFILDNKEDVHLYTRSGSSWTYEETVDVSEVTTPSALTLSSDNTTLFVGDERYSSSSGAVHIYEKEDSVWSHRGTIDRTLSGLSDQLRMGDYFGSSLALDGDTLYVGAERDHAGTVSDAGAVHLLTRDPDNNAWVYTSTITEGQGLPADTLDSSDYFGSSLSLSFDGRTLYVGARQDDGATVGAPSNKGAVYVFTKVGNTNTWQYDTVIRNNGLNNLVLDNSDFFGSSLALDGDTLYVGAERDDDGGSDAGAVHLLTRDPDNNAWVYTSTITEGQGLPADTLDSSDYFGSSLSLSFDGRTLYVGARQDDGATVGAPSNKGAVYVFTKVGNTNTWQYDTVIRNNGLNNLVLDNSDFFGSSLALDGDTLYVGAERDDDGGSDAGAVHLLTRDPDNNAWVYTSTITEGQGLPADTLDSSDYFGSSLSLSFDGRTLYVGARQDDGATVGAPSNKGAVYVFTKVGNTNTWQYDTVIRNNGLNNLVLDNSDFFGSSLALDGDTLYVGAERDDDGGSDAGAVHLLTRDPDNNAWVYTSTITEGQGLPADTLDSSDYFGSSLSLSFDGRTLYVGARQDDGATVGAPSNKGAVYVFTKVGNTNTWQYDTVIRNNGLNNLVLDNSDFFGSSLALDGDTLYVGAERDDDGGSDAGAVHLLTRDPDNNAWVYTSTITEGQGLPADTLDSSDYFGSSLSLSFDGRTLYVGARQDDGATVGAPSNKGAVYVFTKVGNTNTWQYDTVIRNNGLNNLVLDNSDFFGSSLALDGDTLYVGAERDDDGGSDAGAVHLLTRDPDNNAWVYTSTITEGQGLPADTLDSSDYFGSSLSLSFDGRTLYVGARQDDGATVGAPSNKGAVYVFTKVGNTNTWQYDTVIRNNGLNNLVLDNSDFFGSSLALDGDTLYVGAERDDDGGSDAGAVHLLTRDPDNNAWVYTSTITEGQGLPADTLDSSDYFGSSLSLSFDGRILFVGADGADVFGQSNQGIVYVLENQRQGWRMTKELTGLQSTDKNDLFGSSLGLLRSDSEDPALLAVGAPGANAPASGHRAGAVHIFGEHGGIWNYASNICCSDDTDCGASEYCNTGKTTNALGCRPCEWSAYRCVGDNKIRECIDDGVVVRTGTLRNACRCGATTIGNCSLSTTSNGRSGGRCAFSYKGDCSYKCTDGSWGYASNSCTFDARNFCPSEEGSGCSLPVTPVGDSAGSCASGYDYGSCSYRCSGGGRFRDASWSSGYNSCSTTPPPPPPSYPSYPTYGGGGPSYPSYPTYGGGGPSYPSYPTYGGGGPSYPSYPTYGGGGPSYPSYPTYGGGGGGGGGCTIDCSGNPCGCNSTSPWCDSNTVKKWCYCGKAQHACRCVKKWSTETCSGGCSGGTCSSSCGCSGQYCGVSYDLNCGSSTSFFVPNPCMGAPSCSVFCSDSGSVTGGCP